MRSRRKRILLIAPFAILGILLFVYIGGQIVMRLWNWLLPPLFGWRLITFWQALAMLVLCRILFGGLGLSNSGRSNFRRRIAERMDERMALWNAMTPEQREQYRQGIGGRCGFGSSMPSESKGQ